MKRITGSGSKLDFLKPSGVPTIRLDPEARLEIWPADLSFEASCDWPIVELQAELAKHGLALPMPDPATYGDLLAGKIGTLGGLVAMNLPHGLSAQHGGPRDWILGASFFYQGERAHCGSRALKNVAGYDLHRFLVGSRGLFGPIFSVVMRAWPVSSVSACAGSFICQPNGEVWIHRTIPTEFDRAKDACGRVWSLDAHACTIWSDGPLQGEFECWTIGPRGHVQEPNSHPDWEAAARSMFDPHGEWE